MITLRVSVKPGDKIYWFYRTGAKGETKVSHIVMTTIDNELSIRYYSNN